MVLHLGFESRFSPFIMFNVFWRSMLTTTLLDRVYYYIAAAHETAMGVRATKSVCGIKTNMLGHYSSH